MFCPVERFGKGVRYNTESGMLGNQIRELSSHTGIGFCIRQTNPILPCS